MSNDVLVIGSGGHAKVVIDVLRAAGHVVAAVFDDDVARHGEQCRGVVVAGAIRDAQAYASAHGLNHFIIAIGNNSVRMAIARDLELQGLIPLPAALHPSAIIADGVVFGAGTVVMAGVCINADARIGRHCIINTRAAIDHDCHIDDGVHIAPGVVFCGNVSVAAGAFLGAGSTVIPGIRIGEAASIGAGATVVKNISDNVTASGVPARPHRE